MNAQELVNLVIEDLEYSCQGNDLAESNGFDIYDYLLESAKYNDPTFHEIASEVNRNEFANLYEKSLK